MSYPKSTSCGEIGLILHKIFDDVLPYKTDGTFIEIGANDGKTGSFTYNLAKIGWKGINCEPVPRLYNMCCENHKYHTNVINLQLACGEKKEVLQIIDADTLSTIDKDMENIYKTLNWSKYNFQNNQNYISINVDKLDTILSDNNINHIDLMVLDVEGYEENVLKGFSIDKYTPSIFIIEIPDQFKDYINNKNLIDKFKRLRNYFSKNNYTLLVNDVVDNVYIHNSIYNNKLKNNYNIKFPQFNQK